MPVSVCAKRPCLSLWERYLSLSAGDDQRSKRVCLTEQGEQLARTCADRVAEAEARAIGSMSPDDRAALIRLTELYGTLLGEQLQTNQ